MAEANAQSEKKNPEPWWVSLILALIQWLAGFLERRR